MEYAARGVILPRRFQACPISPAHTRGKRGTQTGAQGSPRGRIEHSVARSAALSARARQLTPSAPEREAPTDQPSSFRCRAAARAATLAIAVTALALGLPASALATGGATAPGSGGAAYVASPKVDAVKCVTSCMPGGRVQSGGKIRLRGVALGGVRKVVYRGGPSSRDDVAVRVRPASDRALTVGVPFRAQSGPIDVWAGRRAHASSSTSVKIMPPAAPEPNAALSPAPGPADPGAPSLETATSRSLFAFDQRGGVRFSFRLAGEPAASLQLTLVRVDDGTTVQSWAPAVPAPGATATVSWTGLAGSQPAAAGRYAFRLVTVSASGARAVNADPTDTGRDAFDLRTALFPVKGAHNFGSSGARFGAARSGHVHQGQDVIAACGTPLVAARGGVVKAKQYQSNAGYYLVIDGEGTGVDYAYMHLAAPSGYQEGDRVHTGDQIGVVGETGDATGCHLHFEEWSAPGWYTGGKPFDPLADLQAWDAYS